MATAGSSSSAAVAQAGAERAVGTTPAWRRRGCTGGITLVATGLAVALGHILGDPTIESHDDRAKFVEEVERVIDRIPVIYAFQVGNFLTGFAALGLGAGVFAYPLAWSTGLAPRWLGWLGLAAGALLLLTPLAVTAEVLFLPFFFGAILMLVWLLAAGLWLAARRAWAR